MAYKGGARDVDNIVGGYQRQKLQGNIAVAVLLDEESRPRLDGLYYLMVYGGGLTAYCSFALSGSARGMLHFILCTTSCLCPDS